MPVGPNDAVLCSQPVCADISTDMRVSLDPLVHPISKHASKPFTTCIPSPSPRYSYGVTIVQVHAPFELTPHIEKVEIVHTYALFTLISRQ